MRLTTIEIKKAKAKQKTYKLFDDRGMYLKVTSSGGKLWRLKYRYNNKEKSISLGVYPDVSLKRAREKRDDARSLLADGIDPSQQRKAEKLKKKNEQKNTFKLIASEWHKKESVKWTFNHSKEVWRRLDNEIFPYLGNKPISEINPPLLLSVLRKTESRGVRETTRRLLQYSGKIFRHAIFTGRLELDPSIGLREALEPVQKKHLAAITTPESAGQLMRAIDGYEGHLITKFALQLSPHVFVRPGELRQAEWSEFDLQNSEWNIPGEKMKMGEQLLVPLSIQAIEILKEIQSITCHCKYVFPSIRTRSRPMSNNTVNAALRRLGYTTDEMTGHGFRALARTLLDEVLGVRVDFIEHQLGHSVRDPLGRAYNRTKHLAERRKMMQEWSNYLDVLKAGGKVIPLKKAVLN